MKRVGITGGIGSGKTTIAKLFEKHGVPILDADQLARKLREPGGLAEASILKRFGTTDRLKLREILVRDERAKKDLEKILHPLIHQESSRLMAELEKKHHKAPFLLYEATLLLEAERAKDFEAIIFVTSPENERIARIIKRDQCTEEQAKNMIRAQLGDEVKFALATKSAVKIIKVENHGTTSELEKKVAKVLEDLK